MRQVGILCAAALVALQENVAKLESDHKKARLLAGRFHAILPALTCFTLLFFFFFKYTVVQINLEPASS